MQAEGGEAVDSSSIMDSGAQGGKGGRDAGLSDVFELMGSGGGGGGFTHSRFALYFKDLIGEGPKARCHRHLAE